MLSFIEFESFIGLVNAPSKVLIKFRLKCAHLVVIFTRREVKCIIDFQGSLTNCT